MSKLIWDQDGQRKFEHGVEQCALYVMGSSGYNSGVAWNGITSINESPSGAESSDLWADDILYGQLRSNEKFGGTIEAYTYPDEWNECDGSKELAKGAYITGQKRSVFGLVYKTIVDNGLGVEDYILHLVYNATASPSSRNNQTINDSPEAVTMSWEFSTVAVPAPGFKASSHIKIYYSELTEAIKTALEKKIYGDTSSEPTLPTVSELVAILNPGS